MHRIEWRENVSRKVGRQRHLTDMSVDALDTDGADNVSGADVYMVSHQEKYVPNASTLSKIQ